MEQATAGGTPHRATRADRRLHSVVDRRLDTGEHIVSWSRAWVSRDGRLNRLVAARYRDALVVTDRRVQLWSIGFFTRRPRRCVLSARFDTVVVTDAGKTPRRRIQLALADRHTTLVELGGNTRAQHAAAELLERAAVPAGPQAPQPVAGTTP